MSFFSGSFLHSMPSANYDSNGNRSIIKRSCFGPIMSIEYGITADSKFYFNHTFPEGMGEDDIRPHFEFIEKDRILKAICDEIELCELHKNSDMILALEFEKKKIEENFYDCE